MNEVKGNEFTLPNNLINIGHKCSDCGSKFVVYEITVEAIGFPKGIYCYKCLLNYCKISHRIPVPIEETLADKLRVDLELDPLKSYHVIPALGYKS